MANDNLSIANFIQVDVTNVPQGAEVPNVNSLALFTTETPNNSNPYGIYLDPTSVGEDFGTDSETYAMALAIFSQTQNILNGGGRLVIIPLESAVSATQGQFVTTNISANLSALIAVTDGDIKVTVDGNAHNLTGLDFTACTTLADIAAVLQTELPDTICSGSATAITIQSKKVGTASTIAMAAVSGGTGTNLAGSGFFNSSAGTATAGANASGETIVEAITRTSSQVQYAPFVTNLEMENAVISSTATAVQALDLIWVHSITSSEDIAGIATANTNAGNSKTRLPLYTISIPSAKLYRAAYAGRGFSVDLAASNAMLNMQAKSLATISPDSGLTQTILANAKAAGVDCYGKFGGLPLLYTSGANSYFDEVYSNLWLQFALQTALLNALATTNTKIPQTEAGMQMLVNAAEAVLNLAVYNAVLGVGLVWNSPNVFGNPADLKRNITDKGYYIYYQPIVLQSQTDRDDRISPTLQIAAKRSGAINTVRSSVIIEA
jgi:hypothetical protein